MKKVIALMLGAALVVSCNDNSEEIEKIANQVDKIEQRVENLEELCEIQNSNIKSLQSLILAIQNKESITSVNPIYQNTTCIGHKITFSTLDPIFVYNGANGQDGANGLTPEISVKKGLDGTYYWTINGEWLLDDSGAKVSAQGLNGSNGANGANGVTPTLKIENKYWCVSYDNGNSWQQLELAVGEQGDSFFKDVTYNANYVVFTLANGTTLEIPRKTQLDISLQCGEKIVGIPNEVVTVLYTILNYDESVKVEVISSTDIKAKIVPSDSLSGQGEIQIMALSEVDDYSKIVLILSNEDKVVTKSVYFESAYLTNITSKEVIITGSGTAILAYKTNIDTKVTIYAGYNSDWITLQDTADIISPSENNQVVVNLGSYNVSNIQREAEVVISSLGGEIEITYNIKQKKP